MSQALSSPARPSSQILNSFAAWFMMGACLLAIAFAWLDMMRRHMLDQRLLFERQADAVVIDIEQALSACELILQQAAALMANRTASRSKVGDELHPLASPHTVPGIEEIGFAKAESRSSITTLPPATNSSRRIIKNASIASVSRVAGTASLPQELWADSLSRASQDTIHPRSTNSISRPQYDQSPSATVLMYLPAYSHSTRHKRRDGQGKLLGYVYAYIDMRDFIQNAQRSNGEGHAIKLFEGHDATYESLLYESKPAVVPASYFTGRAKFNKTAVIDMNGNTWTLQFETSTASLLHSSAGRIAIYFVGGVLFLAFALFTVTRAIMRPQVRAALREEAAPSAQERSNQELKNLVNSLEMLREQEQKRLAQEMHDDMGQLLTAMKMDLAGLAHHLPHNDTKARLCVANINELVNTMMTSVRRIISNLPPKALDDLGLLDAVRIMAKNFEKRHQVRCHVCLPERDLHIPQRLASAIYRMIQESLNNVAKHAAATDIEIRMAIRDNHIMLSISDNGKGFSAIALQKAGSFGLIGMRERAAALNGSMRVDSADGEGTTVYFTLPLDTELCCGTKAITPAILTESA